MTHKNLLPGIVRIRYVRCQMLEQNIMLKSICGVVPLITSGHATDIKFYGEPKLSWTGSKENGLSREQTTLEFSTADTLPDGERLAFIVSTASDRHYLIGTLEPKYPVVTYQDTAGQPTKDAALRAYKVTHVAQKSVVQCLI